jgi:hypothetical protein
MAKLRAKIIDRNRYVKRYPFIRGPKRYSYLGDENLAIELGTLTYSDESEKTLVFDVAFTDSNYTVVAMPRSTGTSSTHISFMADGSTLTSASVKILASANFTGQVDVLAIKVG